jgi:hypothetical protein
MKKEFESEGSGVSDLCMKVSVSEPLGLIVTGPLVGRTL